MNGRELITASMRELERVKVIEAVIEGRLRCFQAAERLQRDDRRASGSPSRTNRGIAVRKAERVPGTKKQREFTQADMEAVIVKLAQAAEPGSKPGHRTARAR